MILKTMILLGNNRGRVFFKEVGYDFYKEEIRIFHMMQMILV